MKKLAGMAVLIVVLVVFLTGCSGGGGSNVIPASSAPSLFSYIEFDII